MVLSQVEDFIKKHRLFKPGSTVIAAVSGGPDSVALLHILNRLAPEHGFKLVAAHVNHQLRDEADAEEKFVHNLCREWGVPLYYKKVEVKKKAEADRKGIEETARYCRYQFFAELREQVPADYIATAHHRNDQAETILMHILRGTGIKGLRGILPASDNLVRPLLGVSRVMIEQYLDQNSLSYCLDKSNYDTRFLRNRVRHELIPDLEKQYNPRIIEHLNTLGDIAREEYEAMDRETEKILPQVLLSRDKQRAVINNQVFLSLHPAFQRRILLRVLGWLRGEEGWSALDLSSILDLAAKSGSAKRIKLGQGIWIHKSYDQLIITERLEDEVSYFYPVAVPGTVYIEETGDTFTFEVLPRQAYQLRLGETGLDYDSLAGQELCLRSRQKGDRIALPGRAGRQKIKKYFIDKKIPHAMRNRIPLLASRQEVYAVLGYCTTAWAEVKETTGNILVIRKGRDEETK